MKIEELEKVRQQLLQENKKQLRISLILLLIIVPVVIIVLKSNSFFHIPFMIGICSFIIIGVNVFLSFKKQPLYNKYRSLYKDYAVKKELSKIFTDLNYEPRKGIDYDYLRNTHMIYMGDRFKSEDYISGKYKDVSFFSSDIHIEEEVTTTDSEGNTETHYETIFLGQWMVFDFNKSFKSSLQIAEKVRFGRHVFLGKKYKRVKLESAEFNKKFAVFAESEHEAFYILSPKFMEKIMDFANKCETPLLLCFLNNQLHIGLNNGKNSFEPPSVKHPIDENSIATGITNDIRNITMFVDELELDNDLFKKE